MDIAGDIAEISRDIAFDQRAAYFAAAMIHFLHDPDAAGNGDLVADRRRFDDGAQLFSTGAHGIFDIFLKDRVKLVIIDDTLSFQADDEPAVLGLVDMADLDQMPQQDPIIILRDQMKAGQRQDARSQLCPRHLSAGSQRAHRLMIQQAVRQALCAPEALRTAPRCTAAPARCPGQIPGDELRQHRPGLRVILTHDEPHLTGIAAAAGAAHALQESGHGKRRVDLKCALQPADVDAQLQRGSGTDRKQRIIIFHLFFCAFPI